MEKKREGFKSNIGFILACIGSAVGMGNIVVQLSRQKSKLFIMN